MSREKARLAILSELLAFPTISGKDWTSSIDSKPIPGDLVSLNAAPSTKWYLSWFIEYDPNDGWPKYLLESIEDGEMCWWENVGINIYNRNRVAKRPTWRWDDKQFAFNERWYKVCRNKDAYIVVPMLPKFLDDGGVELDVRVRHGLSNFHNPTFFPDWKKLTKKRMGEFYDDCVEAYHQYEDSIKTSVQTDQE